MIDNSDTNIDNNTNLKKIPSLTSHSVFFKKKQQSRPDGELDFEMEWDPNHKLYIPPTLAPSSFKFNLNNNNSDTIESMSIDEYKQSPPKQTETKTITNVNENNNIDFNKVTINDNGSEQKEDENDDSNSIGSHYKVKRNNNHQHPHIHHPSTQKKPFYQRYGFKQQQQHSPILSPPLLHNQQYHGVQHHHHHHQLQSQLLPTIPATVSVTTKIPEVLEGYLHFIVRLFLVCILFFGIYIVFNTMLHDVNFKYKQYSSELSKQLEKCTKLYSDNRCLPITRIPAMEQQCTEWELCMSKDPSTLPKSKILAEILSEVLESFVSTMSYKTILFLISIIWMIIWIPNKILDNSNKNKIKQQKQQKSPFLTSLPQQHQQHQQPTVFAKNLFTIEHSNNDLSNTFQKRLISDWNK